tara:strand:+ start:276 stop:575 length:300 start_codon:yes stop_codon:yes gene_type:complete
MGIDSHLFLDTLEQVKELLSSPGVASRAKEASLDDVISEFCELTDQYAVLQSTDARQPEDNEALTSILKKLASKIEVIENHNLISLQKLKFMSEVSPKA